MLKPQNACWLPEVFAYLCTEYALKKIYHIKTYGKKNRQKRNWSLGDANEDIAPRLYFFLLITPR